MRRVLLLGVLTVFASACVDFDAAQQSCLDRGGCVSAFDPPTVVATTPANQATRVPVNTTLSVTFSKAMDKTAFGHPTVSPPVALSEPQWSGDGTSFVAQPLAALAYATTYTIGLSGRSTDSAQLAAGTSFSFTTQDAPDTTAPTLLASTPQNGLTGVDVKTHLSLVFSEPMNQTSLDVTTSPAVGLGAPTWNGTGTSVSFDAPLDDWPGSTTCIVQVNATDLAGNALGGAKSFSFRTAAVVVPDTTPPTVVSTTPSPFAGSISVLANAAVTFSEPVKPAGATLVLTPDAGCAPQLDVTNTRLSCNNLSPLEPSTTYTVTVPTSVQDVAGNALAQPFTFQFQTGTIPDSTRPTIVSVSPDGGTGLPVRQPMTVVFSEPMDQASVQQAFSVISPTGVQASYSWSTDGTTFTATPQADLPNSAVVTWQIAATAADLAANTMSSNQQFSFTVVPDTTAPTVTGTAPSNLATNVDVKTNFSVAFPEPMRDAGAVLLTSPDAGCAPTFDSTFTHLSCSNAADLAQATTYSVTVPTSLADVAGNHLASPFTFQFTTGVVPDTTRPTVVSVVPDGGIGYPTTQALTVQFSEPMDQASVQTALFVSQPAGTALSYAWTTDGMTVTASPQTAYAYGTVVKWQVSATAKDLAGNSLLSTQSWQFQVLRSVTTTLTPIDSGNTLAGVGTSGAYVGDNASNQNYRAFFVYTLPSTAVSILSASLTLVQSATAGAPFSTGSVPLAFYVEGIPYTAPISNDDAVAAPFCLGTGISCTVFGASACRDAILLSSSGSTSGGDVRSISGSTALNRVAGIGLGQSGRTFAFRIRRGFLSSNSSSPCGEYFSDFDGVGDYLRYFEMSDTAANHPIFSITYSTP